ncbi:MAG TPA: sensor histidine kinase [Propionibacteriaceae bacterium]|nr:sensor histidine kinase [Propionibacteriaceae bacterium]
MTTAVVIAVSIFGAFASQQLAENEGIADAEERTRLLARAVIEPALLNGIVDREPHAVARLDAAVTHHVKAQTSIIRVKLWTADGRIIYSDAPELVNKTFELDRAKKDAMAQAVLTVSSAVSELHRPENALDPKGTKLLEVYLPVRMPSGQVLLFETYSQYDAVVRRKGEIWMGFAAVTFSSLLLLVILLLPLLWRLLDRLSRAQTQREALLERAVQASGEERRRIAGTLHDGVVQELAATSFVVSGAALRAHNTGQTSLAQSLYAASDTVRTSIGGLRSLLVDIYPPSLSAAGLQATLGDLAASLRTRNIDVQLDLPAGPTGLDKDGERLVFRIAQECLRNAARHAQATTLQLKLRSEGTSVVLDVIDDGIGFDPEAVLCDPAAGHFGLRLMQDATSQANGRLEVRSAPGKGTHWRLEVPTS